MTSAEAARGPRAAPDRRIPGSTAAAWLSVNGMSDGPRNRYSPSNSVSINHHVIDMRHRQIREGRKDDR
ncbi:hypothetical protein [Streptomyces thermolilacinus]|uniref:hypothetical protein n=1 Tax=Streptomyces thermolilacinus TaxID=285540 RepID=UPI00139670F7|nr:hypothetical protein [Streptomyces thermolilacinus]